MLGGGAGTILDMIIRMRNNQELIKKHNYFKKDKKELTTVHYSKQNRPPLSDEFIKYNLNKLHKRQRNDTIRSIITLLIILLLVLSILIGLLHKLG